MQKIIKLIFNEIKVIMMNSLSINDYCLIIYIKDILINENNNYLLLKKNE